MLKRDRRRILFVSALQEELDALWHEGTGLDWGDLREYESIWYRECELDGYDLISACAGEMGQVPTAILVSRLSIKFLPVLVVMVGICGGRKDKEFAIGDVIFSDNFAQYNTGRQVRRELGLAQLGPNDQLPKFDLLGVNADLQTLLHECVDRFSHENIGPSWEANINGRPPLFKCGTYVSADFVLKDGDKFQEAIARGKNVLAVDMESFAAVQSAKHCGAECGGLVIKAVSDHADKDKAKKGRGYAKSLSALTAVSFVKRHFIPWHRRRVEANGLPRARACHPAQVKRPSVLILCSSMDGLDAILNDFGGKAEESKVQLPLCERMVEFQAGGLHYFAAKHPKRMVDSTIFSVAAIMALRPDLIMLAGSCGGIEDEGGELAIGDIIIANRTFHFQFGGFKEGSLQSEIRAVDLNDRLRGFLLAISSRSFPDIAARLFDEWTNASGKPEKAPSCNFAPIATSDLFVDALSVAHQAIAAERKVLGFDMEAYAISRAAAHLLVPLGVVIVRAVADILGRNEDGHINAYCSYLSARFALSLATDQIDTHFSFADRAKPPAERQHS